MVADNETFVMVLVKVENEFGVCLIFALGDTVKLLQRYLPVYAEFPLHWRHQQQLFVCDQQDSLRLETIPVELLDSVREEDLLPF